MLEIDRRSLGNNRKHGHARRVTLRSRTYAAWTQMKTRCLNPNTKDYANYGGRGIAICSSWLNSFENFLADMGECLEGLTLERKDPSGNYEPSNCKWATRAEQSDNKRTTIRLTLNGRTQTLKRWSIETGISQHKLQDRIRLWGNDVERILTPSGSRTVTCPQCKQVFEATSTAQRFCSQPCASEFHYRTESPIFSEQRTCVVCGGNYESTRKWQRYCSANCRGRRGR